VIFPQTHLVTLPNISMARISKNLLHASDPVLWGAKLNLGTVPSPPKPDKSPTNILVSFFHDIEANQEPILQLLNLLERFSLQKKIFLLPKRTRLLVALIFFTALAL
jgi:hypothetical protein